MNMKLYVQDLVYLHDPAIPAISPHLNLSLSPPYPHSFTCGVTLSAQDQTLTSAEDFQSVDAAFGALNYLYYPNPTGMNAITDGPDKGQRLLFTYSFPRIFSQNRLPSNIPDDSDSRSSLTINNREVRCEQFRNLRQRVPHHFGRHRVW